MRYNDLLVECLQFFAILPTPDSFESLARGHPSDLGYVGLCANGLRVGGGVWPSYNN